MLTLLKIEGYKSLFNVEIKLEPLTVFIGPNGSGKSNICEALFVLSHLEKANTLQMAISNLSGNQDWESKYWQRKKQPINFFLSDAKTHDPYIAKINENGNVPKRIVFSRTLPVLKKVIIYDFNPISLAQQVSGSSQMTSSGQGIANVLTDILLDDRDRFIELEQRFINLVPNIARISLKQINSASQLRLVDKYSDHLIPANDISDGTLRILAFLTALYQVDRPSMICFEEPENGIHPWLLHKIMELLNKVATEGIAGNQAQILITTHSPVLLNYVKPEQVRAVELDSEGKTQVHSLPTDSARFQAALEAYDNELGELWFSNLLGGNPE